LAVALFRAWRACSASGRTITGLFMRAFTLSPCHIGRSGFVNVMTEPDEEM
jgi:hypothetical protein